MAVGHGGEERYRGIYTTARSINATTPLVRIPAHLMK
jgi:hypothetical protein